MLEKLKQYFFVIRELTGREIKRKYARSYLGVVWSVLNPLMSMAVLSMIFSQIFAKVESFPIYYLTGLTLWQMFTGATNSAMTALVDNKSLLIKVKLPKKIFPLSRIYTALVNLGYSMIAYVLMLIVFRIRPSITMLGVPLIILLLLLFSIGIGYMLSVAYVFFADIKYLYSVLLTLWMYLSALFYPIDALSGIVQEIIMANPIYGYISAARKCVMYAQWPGKLEWLVMMFWSACMLILGIIVFNKNENMIMQKL